MGLRKGVFVGFWCSPENKRAMQEIAEKEFRSLSQELNRMVEERLKERRTVEAQPTEQKQEARP